MLSVDKLVASARACLGWPYKSPGSNSERGIDCSGLFVKCFRDQGSSIYHGSNTIWRKYCSEKGQLKSEAQLLPGMAVFKHKGKDTAKYPDGQGDFYHIGMVTQIDPLEIVEASSVSGKVITNTKIGKWTFWGKLKNVNYSKVSTPTGTTAKVYAPKGRTVNLRASGSMKARILAKVPIGTTVCVISQGDTWTQIQTGDKSGYMMTIYLK